VVVALLDVALLSSLFLAGCDQTTLNLGGGGGSSPTKATSVTLSATPSPVRNGTVTFTATVTPSDAQGSVTFNDVLGGTHLARANIGGILVPVNNGVGTLEAYSGTAPDLNRAVLGIGTHLLSVTSSLLYPYEPSTSAPLTLLVADPSAICGLGPAVAAFTVDSAPGVQNSYAATLLNQSAVCVSGSSVTLNDVTMTSIGGADSYIDPSGLGATVLAYGSGGGAQNTVLTINGGSIAQHGSGVAAVVASGSGALVNIGDGAVITADGGADSSESYDQFVAEAHLGGEIMLTDATVSSAGGEVLYVDDGSTIRLTGGTLTPEYGSLATLNGTGTLSTSDAALKGTSNIQILNTTGSTQPATLSISSGTWSYISADLSPGISVSDASANVTLTNVDLQPQLPAGTVNYQFLLAVTADQNATFAPAVNMTTVAQQLSGDLEVSSTPAYSSTLNLSLTEGSQWTGAFVGAGTIALTLDADSVWNVTRDTALTTLTDPGISASGVANIVGNGYTVTYVAAQNPALGGKTYPLAGGGTLKPAS
jgi:hypothetical protein